MHTYTILHQCGLIGVVICYNVAQYSAIQCHLEKSVNIFVQGIVPILIFASFLQFYANTPYTNHFFQDKNLHQSFYTNQVLHILAFTHHTFYTNLRLHKPASNQTWFYLSHLLHRPTFTATSSCLSLPRPSSANSSLVNGGMRKAIEQEK